MALPKFIDIEGSRFIWRDLLRRRREQCEAAASSQQATLFELRDDSRPASQRTAAGRYQEPSLFTLRGEG